MDRRNFLALLPAAGAIPAIAATEGTAAASPPLVQRPISTHAFLMGHFPSQLVAPILDISPVDVHLDNGWWRVKFTGWKDFPYCLERTSQWVAAYVGEDKDHPKFKETGVLVYVCSPGYAGVLKRGEAILTQTRLGIPHIEAFPDDGEDRHIQSFMLDVLLDMISVHDWGTPCEYGYVKNQQNIDAAWTNLKDKAKFYIDPGRFFLEKNPSIAQDYSQQYYDSVLQYSRELGFTKA